MSQDTIEEFPENSHNCKLFLDLYPVISSISLVYYTHNITPVFSKGVDRAQETIKLRSKPLFPLVLGVIYYLELT